MITRTFRTPRLHLVGLIWLLLVGVLPPQTPVALASAAACTDGFALWANRSSGSDTLLISGSGSTVEGVVRSNADVLIGGSDNAIAGPIVYASSFANGGDNNRYNGLQRQVAAEPPVRYSIADYRPGGAAAVAAQAVGAYQIINGDLDLAEPRTLSGLYYVTGNAKLSASRLTGTVTVVAEGEIDVSGSLHQLAPYAGGLLLFSNKSAPGSAVVKLAGGDNALQGVIYGPGGMVELSGDRTSLRGVILGDTLKVAGSGLRIAFGAEYCPGQTTPPPADEPAYVADEIVVKLFNAADLAAVIAENGLDPNPATITRFGTRPIFRLRIADGTSPATKAEQLRPANGPGGDSRVQYAEPNYLAQDPESRARGSWVIGQDTGAYTGQWAPATIRLPEAHTVSRGAGITVAVLDTGVDRQHPALAGRLTAGFDFVDFDDDPSEVGVYGTDFGYGHGTHVAGLVALAAPEAKIMPVRVLDKGGVGNIWVLAEALMYTVERGPDGQPASGDEPQVVNLSLGTLRPTRLLEEMVAEATCSTDEDENEDQESERCRATRGVVVVAGAGNDGNTTAQYPAAEDVPGSLALGASTRDDTRAAFSNFGPRVLLAAPGAQIVSTVPGGGYGAWSGTSMATPLAAGVAALLRSSDADLSATAVAERLVETARPIPGPIPGRLDAAAALGLPPPGQVDTVGDGTLYLPLVRAGHVVP